MTPLMDSTVNTTQLQLQLTTMVTDGQNLFTTSCNDDRRTIQLQLQLTNCIGGRRIHHLQLTTMVTDYSTYK